MPRKVSPDAIPTGRLGHTDGPDSRDGRSYTIILSILALFFAVFFFFYFPNEKHQTVQFTPIINDNDINPKMLDISHWELGKQVCSKFTFCILFFFFFFLQICFDPITGESLNISSITRYILLVLIHFSHLVPDLP